MIGVLAHFQVKAGEEAVFEALVAQFIAQVRAGEPGCQLYTLARDRKDGHYLMMEIYADDESLGVHNRTDHFTAFVPQLVSLLEGPPDVRVLDLIA